MNSYLQNTLTWVVCNSAYFSFHSLGDPTLKITPARKGSSSQTSMPEGRVERSMLSLCLFNRPTHAESFFKPSAHLLLSQLHNHQRNEYLPRRVIRCSMAKPHTRPRHSCKSRQNGNQGLCSCCQKVTWVDQHAPRPLLFYGQTSLP